VIAAYQRAGLIDGMQTRFVPTFRTGSALTRLTVGFRALAWVLGHLLAKRVRLMHIHVAQRTSFYRKSVFVGLAASFGVPVILHLHSGEFERFYAVHCGRLRRAYVRRVLRSAKVLVALSKSMADLLRDIVPGAPVEVISNPIELPDTAPATPSSAREPILVYMGRMTEKKGVFDFVEVARRLREQHVPFKALICGSGEVDSVQRVVSTHGLAPQVELVGWVSGPRKQAILESAAVFVLPSYFEGQPMAVLEAMACGTTVVCTRVGGVPDVIMDGQDGLLVEAGKVEELAAAIRRLLDDGALRDTLASAASAKVRRDFGIDRTISALRKLYDRVGV